MAAKPGPPVAAGPYLPDGARCKEVFSKIGEWGPGLRKELAELEAKSQKISNRAEKQLFMKEGQPKIIYTKLMSDFLTRPELYQSSYMMEGRSFEDNELLAVVVASVKDAWVKGQRVPVAFTYLGRVTAGQRSGGLATTLFGTFIRFLYKQGIEYLTCYVLEENTHSLRIFQRLGMLKQGHRVVFCLKVEEGLSLVTFPHEEISTVTTTTSSRPGSAKTVVHRTEIRKVDDDEAVQIVNRFYDKNSILLADIKKEVFQMKQHVGAFHATYTSSDDSSTESEAFALVWDVDYGRVKVNKQNLPYWLVYSPRYKGPKGEDLLAKLLSGIQGLCIEKGVKYLMVEASSTSLGEIRLLQSLPNVLSSSTEWLIACRISRMLDYMKLYQQMALKQKQLKEQQKQAAAAAASSSSSSTTSTSSTSTSSSSTSSSSSSEGQQPSVIPGPRAGPNMIPPGPEDFFYPGAELFQEGNDMNPLAPEAPQVPFFDPRDVSTLMFFTPLRDNAQLQLTRKLSENSATGSSAIKARL